MANQKSYSWNRYWIREGERPTLKRGLFVEPAAESRWFAPSSNGISLSDMAEVPLLVLLGDVGMGKSTVVRLEAERLKKTLAGVNHVVVHHDLKRLTEAQIHRKVFEDGAVQGWADGAHALTLFLDSLDECWRRIDSLDILLGEELSALMGAKTPPLYLRLTCRAAEWRADTLKTLEGLFRQSLRNGIQKLVLAPLSAKNVIEAASANGLGGEQLLKRISEKEVQALASHPITLEMLVRIFKGSGDFPKSRAELYREGCERLSADLNAVYGGQRQWFTTPRQRMAVAKRLAAVSLLTNRLLVNGDSERMLNRIDVLETTAVSGYFNETTGGDQVVVEQEALTETLRTALFSERLDGAQSWSHQSYAEFLAAQYIVDRNVGSAQIVTLLCDTNSNFPRIVPQLEETACWLAEIDTEVFSALAKTNADVLLRCDPTYWNDNQREILVQSYLGLVRDHQATTFDWELKDKFVRLSHPNLAIQLKPIIGNRQDNPLVREMAIDIAAYCKVSILRPVLMRVFLDVSDVLRVRKHAGFALEQIADDQTKAFLKLQDVQGWGGDIDDDLKGHYLRMLWPSHIGIAELLPLITPRQPNYIGIYRLFLEYDLPQKIADADLPQILDWLRGTKGAFDILGDFGDLPKKVFARAVSRIDQLPIRDAVLRLLSGGEQDFYRFLRGCIRSEESSSQLRLQFWRAVVGSEIDIPKLINYGNICNSGLLQAEDFWSFLSEYLALKDELTRSRWATLVFSVFRLDDAVELDRLCEIARTDEAIRRILEVSTSCKVVPDAINWRKMDYLASRERKIEAPQKIAKSFEDLVVTALASFEGGNLAAFRKVCDLLDRDPDDLSSSMLAARLASCNGWQRLRPEVQRRILTAAFLYLQMQVVDQSKVWDKEHRYRSYAIAIPILVLFFDEAPDYLERLSSDDWSKWIGVFFSYSARWNQRQPNANARIIQVAFLSNKTRTLDALKLYLSNNINNDSERSILWELDMIWGEDLEKLLEDFLEGNFLTQSAVQDLFGLLMQHDRKRTERLLIMLLEESDAGEKCSIFVPAAMATLITFRPREWAKTILNRMEKNRSLGKAIIYRLVKGSHSSGAWNSEISLRDLVQLWEWLMIEFPGNPYDRDDSNGNVTFEHDVYHFRNGIFKAFTTSDKPEALEVMADLMSRRHRDFWLGDVMAEMRKTAQRRNWIRPSPSSLMGVFAQGEKRLVRSAGELHLLLLEALQRFENSLHGAPPSTELWNESTDGKGTAAQPKDEMNLSNCVKRFLDKDLIERGIVTSREVQIRRRFGDDAAELVDILVQAVITDENGRPGKPVDVIIELKCAWNAGVLVDMQRQLFDRYLNNTEMHFGIYVVAYFNCPAWVWNSPDARKSTGASSMSIEDLKTELSKQATKICTEVKRVTAFVLDARLSKPSETASD